MKKRCGTEMVPCRNGFGRFVRIRRLGLGLSQLKLSKSVVGEGNTKFIHNLERGTSKRFKDEQLERLAVEIQCDLKQLKAHLPALRPTTTELGTLIRSRREELGLTLHAFACEMGIQYEHAVAMECKSACLIYATAFKLAKVLKLDVKALAKFVMAGRPVKHTSLSPLGQIIRNRRQEKGWSLKVTAEKLGITDSYLSIIERGKVGLVDSAELVQKIADELMLDDVLLDSLRAKVRKPKVPRPKPLLALLDDTPPLE